MGEIFVARSASLSKWGADVGLGKHLFKVGYAEDSAESLVKAGWAGLTDWILVKKQGAEGVDEAEILARLGRKQKMVEPALYPRLKGATGIFKVKPVDVENHILVTRALAGDEISTVKVKPADFGGYLIHNALR